MKLSARHLILELMLASERNRLLAREAVTACQLFAISENSVRVALARLSADGLIAADGRGSYRLTASAMELAGDVAGWRTAEQRLRPWQGDWLVVFTASLGRSDRTSLRRRERALQMLGFRAWRQGLHVRPDNIEADVEAVRRRLHGLGLETEAAVFRSRDWSPVQEAELHQLWDGPALDAGYRQRTAELDSWRARADQLAPADAARESFLLGSQAIRQVVFDPLLPAPMVDVAARATFVDAVRTFDRVGHEIWRSLYAATDT